MFHHTRKSLRNSYFRRLALLASFAGAAAFNPISGMAAPAEKPEYLASFDPAKGFKPAQSDLTEIYLQIAGSLEYYGSPEPYLRHMKAEHERIEAKYQQRRGSGSKSFLPSYMDDAYFDKFSEVWTKLSPKLGLEPLAKNTGHYMREAITGTRGTGTILVEIFNTHQARVNAAMTGKTTDVADFDSLKAELVQRLLLDQTTIHDENFTMAQRDAVDFTIGIRGGFTRLFAALDASLKPTDAEKVKEIISSIVVDVGRMAESELEASLAEHALDRQTAMK
jgi:hypothetical protein